MPFDEGKFGHEKPTGGLDFYKPNFKLRITEKLAELAQEELLVYLQTYYNFDYPFEESGEYKINFFPVYTTVNYANLKMSPIIIDPYSFHFNFTKEIAANGKEK
jgi:hypothetical protein